MRSQLDKSGNLKRPKTKAGIRSIPLLPILEQALRERRHQQLARSFASPDHLVFTTASRKPLDRRTVRNQGIVAAAERPGSIPKAALGLGLDPVRVAKIAGHSSVSFRLNIYADEFDWALHREDLTAGI